MSLSASEEDAIRDHLKQHPEDGKDLLPDEGVAPSGSQFLADPATIVAILAFFKALGTVTAAVGSVHKTIKYGVSLVGWAKKRLKKDASPDKTNPTPAERVLALLHLTYARDRSGLDRTQMQTLTGLGDEEVDNTLAHLQQAGVVRQAKSGHWKFVS